MRVVPANKGLSPIVPQNKGVTAGWSVFQSISRSKTLSAVDIQYVGISVDQFDHLNSRWIPLPFVGGSGSASR